jgi:transcriptional regulator with XRE-family HTH domain
MAQTTKRRRPVREVVGENVSRLIEARKWGTEEAAEKLKMKPMQLRRIKKAENAITMTTLMKLAEGFDVEPYQLLVPGLDPRNPQILRTLSAKEEALYRAMEEAREADR